MKKLSLLLAALMAISLTACGGTTASGASDTSSSAPETSASTAPAEPIPAPTMDQKPMALKQFEAATGPVVTMKTSMGDIEIMLFPDEAPKAVENFLSHARDGYYDGLLFHRVINDFMLQGGDPKGDGTGGESIWSAPFEDEFSDSLHNFRGALAMANSGTDTNGSQFFIVQSKTADVTDYATRTYANLLFNQAQRRINDKIASMTNQADVAAYAATEQKNYEDAVAAGAPEDYAKKMEPVIAKYNEVGGTPFLDNKHTVFGQVTKGMEVVDAIAAVETTEPGVKDKPKEDVNILSITIKE